MAEHLTKLTKILAWTAAAAFAASWFLPVLHDVPGWMAFRYALAPLVPFREAGDMAWEESAPQVMSSLTNVVFVILFGLWASNQSVRPGLFVRIAIACFVLNLYWFVNAWREHGLGELLIGYYVWLAAFALLLATASIIAYASRQTSKIPTGDTPS
ncbi:MAG TPA: hypothetical protein VFU13_02160 [Steroidobacteraceae bacterium]|nr:hypothetical protein [Steroidobacteraceae bacterium]